MKNTTITFFFILAGLFQNCGEKDITGTSKSANTIEVKWDFLQENSSEMKMEILDTVNFEQSGNPPLTLIQDLAFSEDFIFLLDRKQGLLKFDINGKLLQKIGNIGEGPDEYAMPYAIHLDEKENVVLVADWQKMTVISYDFGGKFYSTSSKFSGYPISFYSENDTLLVVQETINGTKEKPRQVLVSSIEPKTLEVKNWERPLYGYHSDFTTIHQIPRLLSRVNKASLFYMPIIRGEISSHSKRDTIFRKVNDHLLPEYQINFEGFDPILQLRISQIVMSDKYVFFRLIYDNRPYFLVIDLERNRPLIHLKKLFDQEMTDEMIPRPFKGDRYYSILRNKENGLEKNPQIVFYRLPS